LLLMHCDTLFAFEAAAHDVCILAFPGPPLPVHHLEYEL
jgi:hypothetical protein